MKYLLISLLATFVVGCATEVRQVPAPVESRTESPAASSTPPPPPAAPVVTPQSTLLASVDAAIETGQLEQAAALCERALRINPRDAYLWYRLAGIRFDQQRYSEAEGFARRAANYAGSDARLLRSINQLISQTQRSMQGQ